MALQGSGQISINDIRNELSSTSGSLAFLSESIGFGDPHLMSEFYGYSAAPATLSYVWTNNTGNDGRLRVQYNDMLYNYRGNDYPYGIIVDNIILNNSYMAVDVLNYIGTGVAMSVYINNNYVTGDSGPYTANYTIFDATPGNDYLIYADSYGPAGEM